MTKTGARMRGDIGADPVVDTFEFSQDVVDRMTRLQLAYEAAHRLTLNEAGDLDADACKAQVEAILGLANDSMAGLVGALEAHLSRAVAAHRGTGMCPTCGQALPHSKWRPRASHAH